MQTAVWSRDSGAGGPTETTGTLLTRKAPMASAQGLLGKIKFSLVYPMISNTVQILNYS